MIGIAVKRGSSASGGIESSRDATAADSGKTLANNCVNNVVYTIPAVMPDGFTVTLAQSSSGLVTIAAGDGVVFTDIYGNIITSLYSQGVNTTVTAIWSRADHYVLDVGVIADGQVPYIMSLGCNSGSAFTYEPIRYSNIAHTGQYWERVVGSGEFTQQRGVLAPSVATDIFRVKLLDVISRDFPSTVPGVKWVSGSNSPSTVTVIWAGDGELCVSPFNYATPYSGGAFTTNKTLTVDLGNPAGGLFVHFRGASLTDLKVIPSVWLSSHDAGIEWSPDYLSYMRSLGINTLRAMDMTWTNENYEEVWADRMLTSNPFWGGRTPWEVIIDLGNTLKKDLWINVPVRAGNNYWTGLSTLLQSNLSQSIKLTLEYTNETWNTQSVFAAGTNWIKYLNHTKKLATIDQTDHQTLYVPAHGYSNGDVVVSFYTKLAMEEYASSNETWRYGATNLTVAVVDADHIQLKVGSTVQTAPTAAPAPLKEVYLVKPSETSIPSLDSTYVASAESMWTVFRSTLPRDQVIYTLGAHHANTSTSVNRVAALTNAANCDAIATAPYYKAPFWGGRVDLATTAVTPKISNYSGTDAVCRLYLAATNPTDAEIIAGTNQIDSQNLTTNSFGSNGSTSWTSGTQITGLTDGVDYVMYFIGNHALTSAGNYSYPVIIRVPFTAAASGTVVGAMSNADAAFLDYDQIAALRTTMQTNVATALGAGLDPICYEGGPHHDELIPTDLEPLLFNYFSSAEYADVIKGYVQTVAHVGFKKMLLFLFPSKGRWRTGTDTYTLTGGTAVGIASQAGKTRKFSNYPTTVIDYPLVPADPGVYPHAIALSDASNLTTLDSGAITRAIKDGNSDGLFSINGGGNLSMASNGGYNFAQINKRSLLIESDTANADMINLTALPVWIGDPGYKDLSDPAYNVQPLWQWKNVATFNDFNQASPDNIAFVFHKTSTAYGSIYLSGLLTQEIPAGGKFTVHFIGKTNTNAANMGITFVDSGFFPVDSTTQIAGACTFNTLTTIPISDTLVEMSIEFTNASGSNKNVSGVDVFVLRFLANANSSEDITAVIMGLYITVP
ncbi:hypothetical protein V2P20_08980 [Methylobacter sp. Wu1]|uniref:hypothetical protein n=1 Tax=Methylobacter sp. Wu1 TaxID=3119359 RepID=UPI002F923DB6